MKNSLLAFTSVLLLGAVLAPAALAADMGLKPQAVAPATYDWSGMYLGGVLGGGWETTGTNSGVGTVFIPNPFIPPQMFQTTSGDGFIGGLEGGSNYQLGKAGSRLGR
jgi:outer membrane immunogenic protein